MPSGLASVPDHPEGVRYKCLVRPFDLTTTVMICGALASVGVVSEEDLWAGMVADLGMANVLRTPAVAVPALRTPAVAGTLAAPMWRPVGVPPTAPPGRRLRQRGQHRVLLVAHCRVARPRGRPVPCRSPSPVGRSGQRCRCWR